MWNHHISATSPRGIPTKTSAPMRRVRRQASVGESKSAWVRLTGPILRSWLLVTSSGQNWLEQCFEKLQKKTYKSRFNDMMKWYNIGGCFWFLLQQSGSNLDVSGLGASRYCEAPPCWRDDFGLALYRMEKIGVMSTKKKIESFRINILRSLHQHWTSKIFT